MRLLWHNEEFHIHNEEHPNGYRNAYNEAYDEHVVNTTRLERGVCERQQFRRPVNIDDAYTRSCQYSCQYECEK